MIVLVDWEIIPIFNYLFIELWPRASAVLRSGGTALTKTYKIAAPMAFSQWGRQIIKQFIKSEVERCCVLRGTQPNRWVSRTCWSMDVGVDSEEECWRAWGACRTERRLEWICCRFSWGSVSVTGEESKVLVGRGRPGILTGPFSKCTYLSEDVEIKCLTPNFRNIFPFLVTSGYFSEYLLNS